MEAAAGNAPALEKHPRVSVIAQAATASLLESYEYLHKRSQQPTAECAEHTVSLMNMATLDTARRGIQQSESVRRLTLLAFLFLPLGITTSFFGMNFREFDGHDGSNLSFLSLVWVIDTSVCCINFVLLQGHQ